MHPIQEEKYNALSPHLNERSRRLYAAIEAKALGRGGKKIMSQVTGLAYETIQKGFIELALEPCERLEAARIRKLGGGRKKSIEKAPALLTELENIVEASTRGDPEAPLLWCSKSTRHIADVLNKDTHRISHTLVGKVLDKKGYSLQSNKKVKEGCNHPDRDARFHFINEKVEKLHKFLSFDHQPIVVEIERESKPRVIQLA